METPELHNLNEGDILNSVPDRNIRVLLDTIEGINQTKEFKSVLIESMEAIRLVMNSEASSLILQDRDTGELYVSMPTGPVKSDIVGKNIPKNKGISGWVVANRRPYLTNKPSESEYFYGELAEGFTTRNIICVPLINRDNEVIGVMQALNRRSGEEFTSRDVPVMQALASHVSCAIERTRLIDRLHDRLKQKDTIIAEIHHRIKNNLQVILSIAETEAMDMAEGKAKDAFKDVTYRIRSMAKLHEMLSEKNLENSVELGGYLKQLSETIQETMSSILYNVKLELESEPIEVRQEQALLCGLILNELLINIYKHAFLEDEKEGKIEIHLWGENEQVKLEVSDNGVGLPEDYRFEKKESIGMWIVEELLKKLNAEISVDGTDGARFTIIFPLK
ncbi:histidine kinase dimerization/phosphoacceptor domain -containing protein [Rhodohalobacter halophilus]|uniref:histidine kinase dimerization/phosphoacceptor domain -containing protein n=1 Tax=Rhodohalobacter halophilus TaxID=1812810 RepID=UPI00083F9931|nr:histidine kinase dimerization/phosphoacceptor domain -containing protein [Rhodohalobacter halophilus]